MNDLEKLQNLWKEQIELFGEFPIDKQCKEWKELVCEYYYEDLQKALYDIWRYKKAEISNPLPIHYRVYLQGIEKRMF